MPEGGGALPEATRHRLLLQGGNGSGKTTILETIRHLWELFGEWIDQGPGPLSRQVFGTHQSLQKAATASFNANLAAAEFGDFPVAGERLWLAMGQEAPLRRFRVDHAGEQIATMYSYSGHPAYDLEIILPPGDWRTFRHRSMVGSDPKPNIVAFGPDDRRFRSPDGRARIIDVTSLGWMALYSPEIDIESLLLTVGALRPDDVTRILQLVNLALRHRNKVVNGWGRAGRLLVTGRAPDGGEFAHVLDSLSSGERQMLLMVAYVAGFLRPGGVVLIDEPDLHIHLSMVTQLMQTLDVIVRERGGQMIVASHSERVWDFFPRDSEKIELTPWRGADQ